VRVLFLQRQPCIRALKYAHGLRAALPDLHLAFAYQGATLDALYGEGDELFDEWISLGHHPEPAGPIRRAIERARPDVIHSHNLPDLLTVLAIEAAGGRVPVIHDIHDLRKLVRREAISIAVLCRCQNSIGRRKVTNARQNARMM